jgi:CRP-like cAMP-binding protein
MDLDVHANRSSKPPAQRRAGVRLLMRINGAIPNFVDRCGDAACIAPRGRQGGRDVSLCALQLQRGRVMNLQRRHEPDWSCRRCPEGKRTLCGALLRGGPTADAQPCPIRQQAYSAAPDEIIYRREATASDVFAVCQGWALRFVTLADGRRQNLAVLLPGDLAVGTLFQERLHFSVAAVTRLHITRFARADLMRRLLGDVAMLELLGRAWAAEQRDIEQRAVDLGRRSAEERVTHLLLSLVARLSQNGVRANHPYPFPLLQRHIADLTGLTPVHVSRVMTQFRKAGLMQLSKRLLTITDLAGVEQIAIPR